MINTKLCTVFCNRLSFFYKLTVIQLDSWLPLHYETSLVPKTWLKYCLKEKLLVK